MNKKTIKSLYCFRHGQTDWNKEKRFQGMTDIPLNDIGRSQARQQIPLATQFSLESLYASPLKRAWETAQILAESTRLKIIPHAGLKEVDVGQAAGLTEDEILRQFGMDALDKWRSSHEDHEHFGFPNGETKISMRKRALQTIADIAKEAHGNNIGIVTHGYFLRQLVIGVGSSDHAHIKNTEVFHFTYDLDHHKLALVKRIGVSEA